MTRPWPVLLLVGCAPPAADELRFSLDPAIVGAADAAARFTDVFDAATETLDVALPAGEDTSLSDALIAAHERGVDVRVVTDHDEQTDPAIAALLAAEVPVTLADAGVAFFDFDTNQDVAWSSADTIMSHAFAVADKYRFVGASTVGVASDGPHVVFEGENEDLAEDLRAEHNQVFGGADATELTAYSSLNKSVTDWRWSYGTEADFRVQTWFGPQQRLVKRVTDATYAAHGSIWVMSDDITDQGLIQALQDKAADGFDVRVLVGPSFGTVEPGLSDLLLDEAPDVDVRQVTSTSLPTLVLVDYAEPLAGGTWPSRVMVATHALWSAGRTYRNAPTRTDQFIDGTLWVLEDPDAPSGVMDDFGALWDELSSEAEEL